MTPEKLHLFLNHIPLIGTALALLPIALGYVQKNRALLMTGLFLAAVSSWLTPFIMSTGEAAEERYEHGPIATYLDADVHDYLELHEERAHFWAKLMYANAVIASLAFIFSALRLKWARPLCALTCVTCLLTILSSIWIADSGGKIRRVDFRESLSSEADH